LGLKPAKSESRGRGRGKGRGRGRGRGKTKEETNQRKGKDTKPRKKGGQSEVEDDQDWWLDESEAGWGDPGEEWEEDDWEASGYDRDGDDYGWHDESQPSKKAKKAKETPEVTGSKKKQPKAKPAKAPKSSLRKTPVPEPTAASSPKPKRKNQNSGEEKNEHQKVKKPRKNDKQCTKDTEQAEQAPAMIYEKDMPKIQKYVDAYKDDSATEATQEMRDGMRAKLKASNLQECRLNIYWRTKAVGCTSRSLGKDIAYFNFNDVEGVNYMSKLAAALKCAKLFVTWVHIDANRMYMCMHQVGGIHETPCILTGETQAFHKYLYNIICMELFMRIAVCLFTGYPHTRPR